MRQKIKSWLATKWEIDDHRTRGNTIVTTNGIFDIIHTGHIRYLQAAKQLGDILLVAVNSDDSVRALRGDKRPIVPESDRMEILRALACVDYVVVMPQDHPAEFLNYFKPDIHTKGSDYDTSTGRKSRSKEIVERYGGQMCFIPLTPGKSTSNLIKTITSRYCV